jgi:type I restriction enzyme, S subunit
LPSQQIFGISSIESAARGGAGGDAEEFEGLFEQVGVFDIMYEKKEWNSLTLEKLTALIKDGTHGTHQDVDNGVPLLSAKDINNGSLEIPDDCRRISITEYSVIHKNYKISKNDILLTIVGSIGQCYLVSGNEQNFTLQRSVAIIRPEGIEPRYLYHYFLSESFQRTLKDFTNASAQGGVYLSSLAKCSVSFPPSREEQTQIAAVLSTVDRAIAQTEAIIAKQQRIKTGLMQDLLTKGIDENGNIRSEETHEFKDSAIGQIPVEWEVSSVEREFIIQSGFTLGQHRNPRKNIHKYLRVANVQRENILLDDLAEIEVKPQELEDRILEENDLLIVEGHANPEEIGRCAIVTSEVAGLTFQNHLFRLRAKRITPIFCLLWLNSNWVKLYWKNACGTSSGLNTINQKMLKSVLMPVPTVEEQNAISKVIDLRKYSIKEASLSASILKLMKNGLMQDLLTGKVRVTELLKDSEVVSS